MHHPVDRSIVQAKTNTLVVRGLTHYYGTEPAVEDVSFEISAGDVVALLGPSGCGKTTVLRAIAGLLPAKPGMISLAGADLSPIPGRHRGIGMVFQNYALFPHMTVAENIGYALVCRRWPRERRRARVAELIATVQLQGLERRLPRELSGGQQQRVAVARAIAVDPALLLLDEPVAALDRALRIDLQIELARLQRNLGITTLIVTHDQEEAQTLADQIVVMNRGHVEQIGSPSQIYDNPASLFVNGFIGHASRIRATIGELSATETTIIISTGETLILPRRLSMRKGSAVVLTTRPEGATLGCVPVAGSLRAEVAMSIPQGPDFLHSLVLQDGTEIKVAEPRRRSVVDPSATGVVFVTPDTGKLHVFPDESPP
jgi:putative spermidine/putrescine transport system ATP-binding protein